MSDELNEVVAGLTRVGEAEYQSRMRQRVLDHLHLVPPGPERRQIENTCRIGVRVEALDPSCFRPPAFVAKAVGPVEADTLASLLHEVRRISDEHVGEVKLEVYAARNGDPEVLELERQLDLWIGRYVDARLARRNPRDDDDPMRRFHRIHEELSTWLYHICDLGVNALVMGRPTRRFPWLLFRDTWRSRVSFERVWEGYHVNWGTVPKGFRKFGQEMIAMGGWGTEGDMQLVCRTFGDAPPDSARAPEIRPRLATLGAAMLEMRPFLVHRFKPERTVVEVAPGVWAGWIWGHSHMLGTILVGRTQPELLVAMSKGMGGLGVAVHPDGRMALGTMTWITLEHQPNLPGAWATNVALLEAIHGVLRTFYDRIDFQSLLAGRWRAPAAAEVVPVEDDDEILAASCEVLSRDDDTPRGGVLRADRAFKVLAELGCEMRPGKGSEVVVSRPGQRMFTLGHHGKNPEIGWVTIRRLLSRLGLTVSQWLEVAHR